MNDMNIKEKVSEGIDVNILCYDSLSKNNDVTIELLFTMHGVANYQAHNKITSKELFEEKPTFDKTYIVPLMIITSSELTYIGNSFIKKLYPDVEIVHEPKILDYYQELDGYLLRHNIIMSIYENNVVVLGCY